MAKVAVDAMGGDHAPGAVIEGALLAAQEFGSEVVLVGQPEAIERELSRQSKHGSSLSVVSASQIVTMDESPSNALRKRNSSMLVAFELMKHGEVQAVVSAGNSGAMMAVGLLVVGPLAEVARPAILIVVPSAAKGTIIIDAGANVDCKPRHLLQFGMMGSVYAEQVLSISKPRVGVLSNGEEEGKGNELTRAASEQLAAAAVNYIGYVEGRDIFNGKVDVVVCDGFTGNVALKTMEGVASFAGDVLKEAFRNHFLGKLGYALARNSLREAYRKLDYAEYGGAPLLGLDGTAIIAHGGSSPRAIKNAIRVANEYVSHDVNRHMSEVLGSVAPAPDKDGLPRKIWQRLRSKIEGLGERPASDTDGKDKESGE
jgi:glycerol-3-phosphate acyltransferase PlsX